MTTVTVTGKLFTVSFWPGLAGGARWWRRHRCPVRVWPARAENLGPPGPLAQTSHVTTSRGQ